MKEQLTELQDTYDQLEGVWSEGGVYRSIVERLNQAYQSVTERVCTYCYFQFACYTHTLYSFISCCIKHFTCVLGPSLLLSRTQRCTETVWSLQCMYLSCKETLFNGEETVCICMCTWCIYVVESYDS